MTVWDLRSRPAPAADANVVRDAAWVRLVLLVAVGGTASVVGGGHDALYLLIDLVWIPWATVVLLAADVPGRRVALLGGPLGDVAGLVAVQLVAPESARGVLFGYLVVVTFATFTAGRVLAASLGATTVAVSLAVAEADHLDRTDLVPFTLALTAVILLARRSLLVHALASARAEGLQTKAAVNLATADGAEVVPS